MFYNDASDWIHTFYSQDVFNHVVFDKYYKQMLTRSCTGCRVIKFLASTSKPKYDREVYVNILCFSLEFSLFIVRLEECGGL